jgi:hypothetical protein
MGGDRRDLRDLNVALFQRYACTGLFAVKEYANGNGSCRTVLAKREGKKLSWDIPHQVIVTPGVTSLLTSIPWR